jgi:hypothetical protein
MADENNKTYNKYFLCLRRNTYIGPPKVLREQEFEGSDRLRSPPDLIGPVRRNPGRLKYASRLTLPRTFSIFLICFSPPGYLIAELHSKTL